MKKTKDRKLKPLKGLQKQKEPKTVKSEPGYTSNGSEIADLTRPQLLGTAFMKK
jgi:hypothetical protein